MKNKLYLGVGISDNNYPTIKYSYDGKGGRTLLWRCPFYVRWTSMLSRCYSHSVHKRSPTYVGCTVCDEWLYFSKFKSWMQTQDWEGNQLDKDLLVEGNKIYSPETCIFLSHELNSFLTSTIKAGLGRGSLMVGVSPGTAPGTYSSNIKDGKKTRYIGTFTSEYLAHSAWKDAKLTKGLSLCTEQTDSRIAEAIIKRFS